MIPTLIAAPFPMIEPAASETAGKSMDWLTFWSRVIGSVVWPLVAVLFILVFRKELTALAQRITKMTLPGGADVTFSQG
jgi:hypothetical protein